MYLTEKESQEQNEKIQTLEQQVKALKKWIKYNTDVDIDMDNLMEWEKEKKEEQQAMTSKELEYYISKIEIYSDIFNYGRVEERKMAESL